MKKISIYLSIAIVVCLTAYIKTRPKEWSVPDHPPITASGTHERITPEPVYVEKIRITMIDEEGNPVGNLCTNLKHIGVQKGPYAPGDSLTLVSTGSLLREAPPRILQPNCH